MRSLATLLADLLQAARTPPWRVPARAWAPLPLFVLVALAVGFPADLYTPGLLESPWLPVLPLSLFVFPALLEEAVFRGLLIPRDAGARGSGTVAGFTAFSTVLFVLWHPFNALLFNPTAIPLFLNPAFLVIVAALGVTCSLGYIRSGSLWVPVLIHWLTVVVWVLFLGGRNLVLEA